jgi:hypothetical protein
MSGSVYTWAFIKKSDLQKNLFSDKIMPPLRTNEVPVAGRGEMTITRVW